MSDFNSAAKSQNERGKVNTGLAVQVSRKTVARACLSSLRSKSIFEITQWRVKISSEQPITLLLGSDSVYLKQEEEK